MQNQRSHFHFYLSDSTNSIFPVVFTNCVCFKFYVKAFPFEFTQDIDVARMYARLTLDHPQLNLINCNPANPSWIVWHDNVFFNAHCDRHRFSFEDRLVGASRPLISTPVIIDAQGETFRPYGPRGELYYQQESPITANSTSRGLFTASNNLTPSLIRFSEIGITWMTPSVPLSLLNSAWSSALDYFGSEWSCVSGTDSIHSSIWIKLIRRYGACSLTFLRAPPVSRLRLPFAKSECHSTASRVAELVKRGSNLYFTFLLGLFGFFPVSLWAFWSMRFCLTISL